MRPIELDANRTPTGDLRSRCADRREELQYCASVLTNSRNNLVLFGERGVGKTFFVRLLASELNAGNKGVFAVSLDMFNAVHPGGLSGDRFGQALLLVLIARIWRDLFSLPYESLVSKAGWGAREISARGPQRILRRIHDCVRGSRTQVVLRDSSSVGASAVIQGERKEEQEQTLEMPGILPYEFAEYVQDIIENVLAPKGVSKVIALCDETNQFRIEEQKRIVEGNIEVFRNSGVQFLYVMSVGLKTDPAVTQHAKPFQAFDEVVMLERFKKTEDTLELLQKYFDLSLFPPNAHMLVHDAFKGLPRYSIWVCQEALHDALVQKQRDVSMVVLTRAMERTTEYLKREIRDDVAKENYLPNNQLHATSRKPRRA